MEWAERWFDDFEIGDVYQSPAHVMSQERIISFASEFDPQRFHIDPVAAADSPYGGLIASGWHTGSVMMRLITGALGPSSLGSPGGDRLTWSAPVRPGDELRLRITVIDKRPSASKPDRGLLVWRNEVRNQEGAVVMGLESTMFLLRRPDSESLA